jgi:glycosyltransferase involved in cell wall biosynthesis
MLLPKPRSSFEPNAMQGRRAGVAHDLRGSERQPVAGNGRPRLGTNGGGAGHLEPGRPLRVALLHNYNEDRQPSMRLYADRLGDALQRQGVALTRVRPPTVIPDGGRPLSPLWAKLDNYVGRFAIYPRLVRDADIQRADVVHIADHGQAYLVACLDPRRTVVTCHDIILLAQARGRIQSSAVVPPIALELLLLSLDLMKRAAAIIADSEQTKRDLVSLVGVPEGRIVVIAPGLNQPFAPDRERGAAFRRQHGLGEGPLMLQLGRAFYKNLPGVLRVLHRLRQGGLDVRVVRPGPALGGSERRLAERLGVADAVVGLGGVPDADLPGLYNAVDLLLFPSLYEGFGWPPLEAMASGTPVVCSRAGSLERVVAGGALTADPEDVDALSEHAAAVLTDGALRALVIARGLAHAAPFRWEESAAQVLDLYRDVIQRG